MKMARIESAVRLVLAFYEAFNRHDVPAMMQLLTDDCLLESASPAPDGAIYSGKEAVACYWQDFFRASPQARIEVEEVIGFGMRCVVPWRCDWTDAAGNRVHVRGVDLFEEKAGLLSRQRSYVKGAREWIAPEG
jgi:ketosteroid isomerase-like protein